MTTFNRLPNPDNLVNSALESIQAGYKVFLLAPDAKVPRAGTKDLRINATDDIQTFKKWLGEDLQLNDGIPNYGIALSDTDLVIDCDPKNFPEAYAEDPSEMQIGALNEDLLFTKRHNMILEVTKICPDLLNTRRVYTPSCGYHFYVKKPAHKKIAKTQPGLQGIDFITAGFHVLGPGSFRQGKEYALVSGHSVALEVKRLYDKS